MKVIVGEDPAKNFKIIGESGADITRELLVKTLTVTAHAGEHTRIVLEVIGNAEIEAQNVTVKVRGRNTP